MPGLFGHCPNGGGVSTLAQMVWGTYFEKNCSCSKGHLLGLGGLNPCQDGLGHLCSENWSSNGIYSSRSGNKVPQSARLSEGGGVQSLFGQCPNRPSIFLTGASLIPQPWVGAPLSTTILRPFSPVLPTDMRTLWGLQKCIWITQIEQMSTCHPKYVCVQPRGGWGVNGNHNM